MRAAEKVAAAYRLGHKDGYEEGWADAWESRCLNCEEPIEVLDWCYSCEKLKAEPPTKTGPRPTVMDRNLDPGPCLYGHTRRWGSDRWVCDECLHMYYERRKAARKVHA